MSTTMSGAPPDLISLTTLLSLSSVLVLLLTAFGLSRVLLPSATVPLKTRLLFLWHAFDFLVHFTLEASFLYNCFFTYTFYNPSGPAKKSFLAALGAPIAGSPASSTTLPLGSDVPMTPQGVNFLGQASRLYGSFYSTSPSALLWQEYAKADRRWGGSDLGIISLELLTVFVMAPLAVYVCWLLSVSNAAGMDARKRARADASAWFWMTVVATGELYGGFMTFAPEWLSGSGNLDTSNWMYMWLYLVFFNVLWVFIPGWVLWEAVGQFSGAFERAAGVAGSSGAGGKKKK